jgi:hypothetical protein
VPAAAAFRLSIEGDIGKWKEVQFIEKVVNGCRYRVAAQSVWDSHR